VITWRAVRHIRRRNRTGVKRLHHPVVGDLSLTFEALDLAADAGLRISAYTAEPGSPSADALNLLASWAVTLDQSEAAQAMDEA
jgi:MmyB-like transcription regulator ligand binding domain